MIIDTSIEPETRPPRTQTFRKYEPVVRFTPDQSRRQNDLLRLTWQRFKSKEAVIGFLNTYDDGLGGDPLSLALSSDDGLKSVECALREMAPGCR
ncbi:MAG TPA: hypothetical protein VFH89_12650 [Sphingomicrobium sp.]|nr:hypothetical protein [Sphingomicrobium sp.]